MILIEDRFGAKILIPDCPYGLKATARSVGSSNQAKHTHQRRISRFGKTSGNSDSSIYEKISRIGYLKPLRAENGFYRSRRTVMGVSYCIGNRLVHRLGNGVVNLMPYSILTCGKWRLEVSEKPLGDRKVEVNSVPTPITALRADSVVPPRFPSNFFAIIQKILRQITGYLVFVPKGQKSRLRRMEFGIPAFTTAPT